jgi:dipeptidyl aminopeptidase/acylaminoacyl peptidase
MTMVLGTAATLGGAWALRQWVHWGIVQGLRAPRVPHAPMVDAFGLTSDRVRPVHIPTAGGKRLVAWWVSPPQAATAPAPVVLVMHGWGANASMMGPVVPPLHAAGFAVLLLDARCHGHSDDETFTSMPRFAEDIASGLAWLKQQPDIATDRVALLGWYVMRHVQRVIGVSFDEIAPLRTLSAVRCPTLLVHGILDRTVPVEDAYRLLETSSSARLLLVEGDHDLREALAPHAHVLVNFLRRAFEPATPAPRPGAD